MPISNPPAMNNGTADLIGRNVVNHLEARRPEHCKFTLVRMNARCRPGERRTLEHRRNWPFNALGAKKEIRSVAHEEWYAEEGSSDC